MSECIYSNNINKSILTSGFTIPVDKWDAFSKCLGVKLQKGERKEITVWLGNLKRSATYTNVNLTGDNAGSTVSHAGGVMSLKGMISKILNEYVSSKQETFAGHQMGSFFRTDIPLTIYGTGIVPTGPYLITGSVGQGNWAMIPWICIFDRKITTSETKGIYIVYLLSKDGNSLYLSFNQGCTDIRKNHTKKETITIMHENAESIRNRIDSRGFSADNAARLGDGLTELGELYQEGMIFYKEYRKGSVPEETELQDDLRRMMEIYKEYVDGPIEEWWPKKEEYDPGLSKLNGCQQIK
ncbi:MAG: DUF3578 domain-containing protein [Lachnospiraceae bacterium]|nr:DUF3578 domain-containing protein [Lachnospiraceae bacterium]